MRNPNSGRSKCHDYYEIAKHCYKSESNEQFVGWLDEQFRERQRLMEFLRGRRSTLVKELEGLGTLNVFGMAERFDSITMEDRERRVRDEMKFIRDAQKKK
jgi:hypothetical protein